MSLRRYYPDKPTDLSKEIKESLFSYKIIILNGKEIYVDDIMIYNGCPKCKRKLSFSNCFNNHNQYQVSLFRFCHQCNTIYLLSGYYTNLTAFKRAVSFFINLNKKGEK